MLLDMLRKQVALLHASWTEWKKTFSFEIYGRDAKLEISGWVGVTELSDWPFTRCSPKWGRPKP